jgi:hypothetical protein
MDSSEKLVEAHLKSVGYRDVRYEPDGNIPPDFLADGKVAIEVRRLNQNFDDKSGRGIRGLEEVSIPLWNKVREYLIGLGPARSSDQSWFVIHKFARPTPAWRDLKRELDAVLLPFMASNNPQPFEKTLNVRGVFEINVFRASAPKPTFFRPGGHIDEQSGGWLIAEIAANLQHCIDEKSMKIARYRSKYPVWWLVLPDHIGYGLDEFDKELLLDQATIQPGVFDRIILLDPHDATRATSVFPSK